jgi:hypothetical protein
VGRGPVGRGPVARGPWARGRPAPWLWAASTSSRVASRVSTLRHYLSTRRRPQRQSPEAVLFRMGENLDVLLEDGEVFFLNRQFEKAFLKVELILDRMMNKKCFFGCDGKFSSELNDVVRVGGIAIVKAG